MGKVVKLEPSLDDLVIKIRGHVFDAGRLQETQKKHVFQAGLRLLELRQRVEAGEAGEIGWWEYFDTKFVGFISNRKHAERVMRWARADDPDAAIEAKRENDRERQRAVRKRRLGSDVTTRSVANGGCYVASTQNQRLSGGLVDQARALLDHMDALLDQMDEEQLEWFRSECRSRLGD